MEFNLHTSIATLELAVYIQTFQRHRILRIKLLNHQTITYKVLNNLTPEYLNVFQYVSQVSSRITRQSVNKLLVVTKATTKYYRRSFAISSCNLWNNMSNEIFRTKYVNDYFN